MGQKLRKQAPIQAVLDTLTSRQVLKATVIMQARLEIDFLHWVRKKVLTHSPTVTNLKQLAKSQQIKYPTQILAWIRVPKLTKSEKLKPVAL